MSECETDQVHEESEKEREFCRTQRHGDERREQAEPEGVGTRARQRIKNLTKDSAKVCEKSEEEDEKDE